MNIRREAKLQNGIDANRAAGFSHSLGRDIVMACDERVAGLGLPLGDYEIAIDEGTIVPLKSKAKEAENLPATEESETDRSGKIRDKTLKQHLQEGFDELKKLLTTDWGDPQDDTIDFNQKLTQS